MSSDLRPERPQPFALAEDSYVDLSGIPDLQRLAKLPVDLLLEGETGCGKDTVARAVHGQHCPACSFVYVNCAAIPEPLIESEIFGVEAGAFTGAMRARAGKIEAADGGVLYLDEIDSMDLHLQAKLLHVLQFRGSVRLGGNVFRKSSFRLIASTKERLKTLVERGRFRGDLYYRLNTVTIRLPALRNQVSRIIPTLQRMLVVQASRLGQRITPLSPTEESVLLAHSWPGNYRELLSCAIRHLCGRELLDHCNTMSAAASSDAHACEAADVRAIDAEALSLKERLVLFESKIIAAALAATGGNVARAARRLKVSPQSLHYRIRTLNLLRPAP